MNRKFLLVSLLSAGIGAAVIAASLPYTQNFSDPGDFTVIDGNNDGIMFVKGYESSWSTSNYVMKFNGGAEADEWLISPSFQMEEGMAYEVNFKKLKSSYGGGSYNVDVVLLTDTSNPNTGETVASFSENYGYSLNNFSCNVSPAQTGIYYIGIHLKSDVDEGTFMVDDFSVSEGISAATPKTPVLGNISHSVAGDKVNALFDITAPSENIGGQALTGDLTLVVTRSDNGEFKKEQTIAPGEVWNFVDDDAPDTSVYYHVIAKTGDLASEQVSTFSSPYFAQPSSVTNFNVEHDGNGGFSFSWDPVTTGVTDDLFIPSRVTYTIKSGSEILIENTKETSATYTYEIGNEPGQENMTFTITAQTNKVSDGVTSAAFLVGNPYTGEYAESFAGRAFTTKSWTIEINNNTWMTTMETYSPNVSSQDNDGGMLVSNTTNEGRILSPIINVADVDNPILKFYLNRQNDYYYVDTKVIVGFRNGDVDTDVATFYTATTDETGWYEQSVIIPESVRSSDFRLYFYTPGSFGKVYIDNITIKSYLDNDLEMILISAPEKAEIGDKVMLTADILNAGINDVDGYNVVFYADNEEIGRLEMEETLAAQTKTRVSYEFTALPKYAGKDLTIKACAEFESDQNADNNEASTQMTVNENDLATAVNIAAATDQKNVTLTWNAPEVSTDPIIGPATESFEGWPNNSTEGLNGWIFTGTDNEKKSLFGVYGNDAFYHAMVTEGYVPAYGTPMLPYEGTTMIMMGQSSTYYPITPTDSWIISPEVAPGSDISFYACGYYGYGTRSDTISLLWSDGSTETADFQELTTFTVKGNWEEFSATLPEGAKRFAVRFNGVMDHYNICFDKFTYQSYTSPAVLTGFNIYRDDELIANVPTAETSLLSADDEYQYVDSNLADGVYNYYITATYDRGESMPTLSAEARIGTVSVDNISLGIAISCEGRTINIVNDKGLPVIICDLSGRVIANGMADMHVEVAPGIYIINADGNSVKVYVR